MYKDVLLSLTRNQYKKYIVEKCAGIAFRYNMFRGGIKKNHYFIL